MLWVIFIVFLTERYAQLSGAARSAVSDKLQQFVESDFHFITLV